MVQEDKACGYTVRTCETRDPAAKKAGYDAVRRAEAERQRVQQEKERERERERQREKQSKSYGSWGPVFKNRENFNSLHIC